MSPVTKFEDQPAVSLCLVKPASNKTDLIPINGSDDQTSRAAMMQLIFELMLLIGTNMSKMQKANAETQMDQAKIAQDQAEGAKENMVNLTKELDKLQKEQEKADTMNTVCTVLKWVGVGLSLVAGALLCETPLGFVILAATIAFMASPLFTMATNALAGSLESLGLPPAWAKIVAQVIIVGAVVIMSFGTEAVAAGAKTLTTVAEDTTQVVAKTVEENAEEIISETGANAAKNSTRTFTAASTQASFQALMSSSIIPDLIQQIPDIKKHPWLEITLTVVAMLATMAAAAAATPVSGGMSMLEKASALSKVSPLAFKVGMQVVQSIATITTDGVTIGVGENELKQSEILKKIAPIQAQMLFNEGFLQIMTQLTTMSQQSNKQTINSNQELFKIDFSADMRATVAAQLQG